MEMLNRCFTGAGLSVLFVCLSMGIAVAGESKQLKQEGQYSGKVVSISKYKAASGDKRFCRSLTMKLISGEKVWSEFYLFVNINEGDKLIYSGPIRDVPQADIADELEKIVKEQMKPGTKIAVSISCGMDAGCYIYGIDLTK